MDELKGNEICNAGNAFEEVEKQLCFHGVGRPDKHFGQNAHPSFTYVFSYFYPSIVPARCYTTSYYGYKVHCSSFMTERELHYEGMLLAVIIHNIWYVPLFNHGLKDIYSHSSHLRMAVSNV